MATLTARDRMLAGLAATKEVLPIAGISTSVYSLGAGPPIVLVHGGIECGGAMWAPAVGRLAERYRVVVPDVPGLGESAPANRLDPATFANWFSGVLDAAGLDRPVVIAHSLVGGLVARFASGHSDALRKLVLYGVPAIGPYRMPLRLKYVAIRAALRPTPGNAERFARFALLDIDATRRRDPDWFAAFSSYNLARATVPHVKRTMRELIASQTKQIPADELDRISTPTVLLWGRGDRMVPLAVGIDAARRHDWPLRVVDGAAHVPHIEQPDAFCELVESIASR
jgi:pimeloyl-ACP methyl ester carboxylesterase